MKNTTEKLGDKLRKVRKGLNIFYYGKGKGKTTAAMGLAVRAAGAGLKVYILQFVKSKPPKRGGKLQSGEWPTSSEMLFFAQATKIKNKEVGSIENEATGAGFVGILGDKKERAAHVAAAQKGLKIAQKLIKSDKYDLIIFDELISALELKLITEKQVITLLKSKPKHLHLAYTGHDFFDAVVAASDIASEIKMIKHPYYKGILAQRGIDY